MPKYAVADLTSLDPVRCPCGWARRAFGNEPNAPASVHLVTIGSDSRPHYHKNTTEFYVVLQGEGFIELDGERVEARPMTAVMIKPGCRHRAVGKLTILNVPVPAFDPTDEFED
jgi:mannose-6-phosphate isomerase-like protein (cupin superfamily)